MEYEVKNSPPYAACTLCDVQRTRVSTGVSYQPVLEMFTWFKVSAKGFTKWPANRVKSPFSFSAMQSAKL